MTEKDAYSRAAASVLQKWGEGSRTRPSRVLLMGVVSLGVGKAGVGAFQL